MHDANPAAERDVPSTPKVSAIIPCYNRARFIAQTVRSVLEQTYPNIELIVVDDGCTDGSREVLAAFGDRLTLLEHPGRENRGQSAAINLALSRASGKYVGILDSDDLWLPRKIEEQVAFMESHPDVGLIYGNGTAIDEHGRQLYVIYAPGHEEKNQPAQVLMDCYFLVPNNSLVRREIFERIGGFDESLRAAQDHDVAIRIAEVARLAYLDRPWFSYRRHAQSISRRNAGLRWRNGFRILEKAAQRKVYDESTLRKRRGVLHFRLGQCYLETWNVPAALWHFLRAFGCDPARAFSVVAGREPISSPH
jgi:glycosyltransferase involved in cell wall biosynthesis